MAGLLASPSEGSCQGKEGARNVLKLSCDRGSGPPQHLLGHLEDVYVSAKAGLGLRKQGRGNDREDASDWRDMREGGEGRMMREGQRYGVWTRTGRVPRVAWVSRDSQETVSISFMRSTLGHESLRQ